MKSGELPASSMTSVRSRREQLNGNEGAAGNERAGREELTLEATRASEVKAQQKNRPRGGAARPIYKVPIRQTQLPARKNGKTTGWPSSGPCRVRVCDLLLPLCPASGEAC